ncbi:MAG: hypothetical protein ACO3JL_21030, partial [Myxococcota bacterium]
MHAAKSSKSPLGLKQSQSAKTHKTRKNKKKNKAKNQDIQKLLEQLLQELKKLDPSRQSNPTPPATQPKVVGITLLGHPWPPRACRPPSPPIFAHSRPISTTRHAPLDAAHAVPFYAAVIR